MGGTRNWLAYLLIITAWLPRLSGAAPALDASFKVGTGANGFIEHVLPLDNGQILAAGIFTWYNGSPRPYLARLNEDGSLDSSFNPQVNYWIRHMSLQPDGKIIIVGAFSAVENQWRSMVARLNSDGSLDTSFNPGLGARDKLVESDPNPPYVFWCDLQPDGKVIIVGSFAKYDGRTAKGIARLNPDGSYDTSFKVAPGLDSWGRFVRVLPNGQIMVTGWFTSYNGVSANRMVLLNADGTPDLSFRPFIGDKTSIYHALPLADGKWLVSGHSKNEQGLFHRNMTRLNANGTEDTTFLGRTNERTEYLLTQPDGKILAFGWFTQANDQRRVNLARFHPDGTLDTDFKFDGDNFVWSAAFDSKGRLLVSGGFININGIYTRGVARLLLETSTQQSLPPKNPLILGCGFKNDSGFQLTLQSESDRRYTLEFRDDISSGEWQDLPPVIGTGSQLILTDPSPASQSRCYRVRVE